jgi:hypothetical protein
LEHRVSNPVSVKNLTAIETSTIVPVGTKKKKKKEEEEEEEEVLGVTIWQYTFQA